MFIKRLTVGTSAVSFAPSSLGSGAQRNGLRIIADQAPDDITSQGNTAVVTLGFASTVTVNSSDTTDGHPIRPGGDFYFPIDSIKAVPLLWFISSASGQKITIILD